MTYFEGVGRRKAASARVRIHLEGSGQFTVNSKPVDEYFPRFGDQQVLLEPLATTETIGKFDVTVLVNGGGVTGQRDAVRLGLARALLKYEPEMRSLLRRAGFLTRDARVKERKKPGLKKARKAPTYTKR